MTRQISKIAAGLVAAVALSVPGFTNITAAADPGLGRGGKVIVIPFSTLNVPADQQWIGKGLQESLIADLGRDYAPVAFSGQTIVEDNATAARVAREAGVPYAVRGVAQEINGEIRLTAQMIDAKTGDTLSTANVTGQLNNLLRLEDEVGAQLRGVTAPTALTAPLAPTPPLPPATTSRQITTYTMPSPPATYQQPTTYQQPQTYPPPPFNDISLSAQNYNSYYPGYSYYPADTYYPADYGAYYAPYYPVYYPPFYSAFGSVFIGFGGRHFGFHDGFHRGFHDGFHDGFHGGFHDGFHGGFGAGGFHGGFGGGTIHFGGGGFGGGHMSGGFGGGHGGRR